ncbi:MAG: response regulator [Firmicutes bacterium]|jgi:DNA-binding response OmpR family regulator|nr:response regulator [Bacillota bacterium]
MGEILLVEDEKNIILGVRTCLEAVGYDVHVVEDGEEALDYVNERKPDLILLDLMLPKVDGFEVCRTLKSNEETKDIPIIVLTARTGMEDRQRVAELGAESYMTKPFRPQELWDKIKHYLPDKGEGE